MASFNRSLKSRGLFLAIVACLAGSLALASDTAQAQTKLRWKFKAGEKIAYDMHMEMGQEMNVGGNPVNVTMKQQMGMTWAVTDVQPDGTANMTQTMDRIRMEMQIPIPGAAGIKYDSAEEKHSPEAEIVAPIFDAMVGKSFTMKISPLGTMTDLTLPEGMADALKKSPLAQMGEMFSAEGMKQMLGRGMLPLPEEAVKKGTTWDSSMEMKIPMIGKQVVKMTFTDDGEEQRDGKTLEKINMDVKTAIEKAEDAKVELTIKDEDSKGSVVYFDNKAGRIEEMKTATKMTMEISVGGMDIEQKISTTVTLKQVKPTTQRDL